MIKKAVRKAKRKAEERFGRFISKLYWTYGRRYDGHSFWTRILVYHLPNGIDGKFMVAQLNEMTGRIELRAEGEAAWLKDVTIGFKGRGSFKANAPKFPDPLDELTDEEILDGEKY
jgi:hypothetical protein